MNNNNVLLTLGLPVYNGEGCIASTIESIVVSLKNIKYTYLIEILILDNLSTDKTSNIVNRYIDSGLNIKYYCNKKNIGYDGNIDQIVKKATGKYVWFLGCGEKIKENSISRLIEKLDNSNDYTNILLDFDIYDEIQDKITDKRIYSFDNDILISLKNDFKYNKYGLAVSSNIINKNKWMQISNEKFTVDGWCHVERILSMIALSNNSKTLLLPEPYFTLYREKNGWWTKPNSYLLLLLLLHIDVIDSMHKKGFSEEIIKKLRYQQMRMSLIGAVIQSKSYGLIVDKTIILDMIKRFKTDYFFWLFVLPILILPKQLDIIPRIIIKVITIIKRVLQYVKKHIF